MQCLHEYSKKATLIKLIIFMHIHTCSPLFRISRDYCFEFKPHSFANAKAKSEITKLTKKVSDFLLFPEYVLTKHLHVQLTLWAVIQYDKVSVVKVLH